MTDSNFIGRLTWNPVAPAPFESAWSIYTKILAHNQMKIGELANLIRKSNIPLKETNALDFRSSKWIDFEKFGQLLEINPERLKTGYLDQLGFYPYTSGYNGYKIRHCPECAKIGFHCVLFDLAMIKECPWHRCELGNACYGCGAPSTINGISRSMIQDEPCCHGCGLRMSPFLDMLNLNKLDPALEAMVAGYCIELVDWWQSVRIWSADFSTLSEELQILEGQRDERHQLSSVLLGYAKTIAPQPLYWTFSVEPRPARYAEWNTKLLNPGKHPYSCYSTEPTAKMYRSIRRHIYRKFVRPYRRSLSALMSLSRIQCFALRGDKICVPAMAYVMWRMSIEGMCNIEGLRFPRKAPYRLRLMGPDEYRINLPLQDRLLWSYLGFFGLCEKLQTCLQRYECVSIDLGEDSACTGFLNWCCDPIQGESDSTDPLTEFFQVKNDLADSVGKFYKMKVVFPEPFSEAQPSVRMSKKTILPPEDWRCLNAKNKQSDWDLSGEWSNNRRVLFKFSYSELNPNSRYCHIIV
jgi:hypothetical protein